MTELDQPSTPLRRLVVFADGTGNAFTSQESNVWRLYQALDQTADPKRPRQIARYIPGVGTSGFRPFAVLDAATGIGVPSNVRKLYRFLCWNWRPGDEIWIFGFSRGAFTVRTLAGLIASQGLVPARFGTEPTSRAEMERNAAAAWRAYRARSARWYRSSPLIWIGRTVRNAGLWVYHGLLRHRSYRKVRAEMERQALEGEDRRGVSFDQNGKPVRVAVPVTFMGLFDTVEAFGVPIEEMRRAIDWAIWPISFRNRTLAPCVDRARHALALDDERTSFHPVRFDRPRWESPDTSPSGRIVEVWFAGVHSDVGGGYPDGELSYVPLVWMVGEAQRTAGGLDFTDGAVDAFRRAASPFGPIHDSRSGLGVAYRYDPRSIETKRDPHPVIHHSVLTKMVLGSERYAPIMLPATAQVLLDQGRQPSPLTAETSREALAVDVGRPKSGAREPDSAETVRLPVPNDSYIALTRDGVWWRRVAYFLLLVAAGVVLLLPWIADALTEACRAGVAILAERLGLGPWWARVWSGLAGADAAIGGTLEAAKTRAGGLIPAYLAGYIEVLVRRPLTSLAVLTGAFAVYRLNAYLRDFIADKARCAWFADAAPSGKRTSAGEDADPGILMLFARLLRQPAPIKGLHRATTRYVLPGLIVLVMGAVAAIALSRVTVIVRTERAAYCRVDLSRSPHALREGGAEVLTELFPTNSTCWSTGIAIEKGRRYLMRIEVVEPFFDGEFPAGALGFKSFDWPFIVGLPIRRRLDADWFQPVVRIGREEGVEFPLRPIDGTAALNAGAAAGQRTLTAEFTAGVAGELFLYVDDVLVGLPFVCDCAGFYANNSGRARVTVAKFPLPDLGVSTQP